MDQWLCVPTHVGRSPESQYLDVLLINKPGEHAT
uniref:Uncharacterized protein n=1 Tax=Anguilla anguilla TaxID=7936 RepID=A0A0E9QCP4_ANGAN